MDKNLHTEDIFYSNLEGHAEEPPAASWDQISQTLDRDNLLLIKKKYNRLKSFAALLLLLVMGFGIYVLNNGNGYSRGSVKTAASPAASPAIQNFRNTAAGGGEIANHLTQMTMPVIVNSMDQPKIHSNNISVKDDSYPLSAYRANNIPANSRAAITVTAPEAFVTISGENDIAEDIKTPHNIIVAGKSETGEKLITAPAANLHSLLKQASKDSTHNNFATLTGKKKNKRTHDFSLTPFFSPDIAWYRLQDDKPDNNIDDAVELEKTEQHEFSSTFGITAEYTLNDRWSLQSGVNYSNTNITMEPKVIYASRDIDGTVKYRLNTSSGDAYLLPSFISQAVAGDSLSAYSSLHTLQYIGIPAALVRRFSAGQRFTVKAIAGITTNILVHSKVETIVAKGFQRSAETIDRIRGLKKMYFGGVTGLGLEYRVGKRTALSLAPSLRFAISSINADNTVKSFPMSFGFKTGVKISL